MTTLKYYIKKGLSSKMKKNNLQKNYSIGIDVGTNSVGWAVMGDDFQLLKKGNKNLWGVRLFDSANSAAERRMSRSTRRRYNKRRLRIRLLQQLLENMIMLVDDTFLIRLKNTSFLVEEDKKEYLNDNFKDNYNLFIDKDFNDQDYYKLYPTIYHLRNHLVLTKEKVDPRLIYLALHHIVKYRGNFLYENSNLAIDITDILEKSRELFIDFADLIHSTDTLNAEVIEKIISILKEKLPKKLKVDMALDEINIKSSDKECWKQFFSALIGLKFDLTKMFKDNSLKKDDKNIGLQFSSENYEEDIDEHQLVIEEFFEFINKMEQIYSWIELQGILGNTNNEQNTISEAMIERYNKHHTDLVLLKKIVREYIPQHYNYIFRKNNSDKIHNYYSYINCSAKTKREDFYKFLKKELDKCPCNKDVQYCLDEVDKDNFLLKQNDRANANIPFQLNEFELRKILTNQMIYYPELKNNFDKIVTLLTYKTPYYVGPLNPNSSHAWLVKDKEDEYIYPWNQNDIINVDKTANEFIQRMLNHCTYLPDEYVMPKYSLTASMYEVLSELNKIRVDGKFLSVDVKNKIINDLFMNYKTVTDTRLRQWFKKEQLFLNNEDLEITGYQKENTFSSSLTSWIDFKKIYDNIDENYNQIEKIIEAMTIFEDKSILKRKLKMEYHLDNQQIQYLMKKRYKGWSRLSNKLINGLTVDNWISSHCTILNVMKATNFNLMQILQDKKLGFKQKIDEETMKFETKSISYEDIAALAGSPAIKRGIWQSIKIIDEIIHYMKSEPTYIYVEFAREDGKKKRTVSQIKKLQDIYKNLSLENDFDKKVYRNLFKEDNLRRIDNEKLYLYYTQLGKCMYSGKELEIDKLYLYEVDHIIPQSLIKDDSLDNKVLVIKDENQRKLNDPSLSSEIIQNNVLSWKRLLNNGLITQRKFFNLIRTEYNENTTEKFINRQLVETRQIIKNVSQLILQYYPSTQVMAIRANLTHQFREKYRIYKNRNVNDYHHAHDAYIACIVGQYISKCYPNMESNYLYGEYMKVYKNMEKKRYNDGFLLNGMNNDRFNLETGELVWKKDEVGKILKCFDYKDCYITKKLEDNDSALFKATIVPGDKNSTKGKTDATLPVNKYREDVHKYGGYTNLEYEYIAVEGINKKKFIRKLSVIPIVYRNRSIEERIQYIEQNERLSNVKILTSIKKNQLIFFEDGWFYITGGNPRGFELTNAEQLILSQRLQEVVFNMNKAIQKKNFDKVQRDNLIELYEEWLKKLELYYPLYNAIFYKIKENNQKFYELSVEEMCLVLEQLLLITQANSRNGNLKFDYYLIGDRMGRIKGKKLLLEDVEFVDSSITGIYSRKKKI